MNRRRKSGMRVVQVIASLSIRSGGPGLNALRLAQHFATTGWRSEILTLADGEITFPLRHCEVAGTSIRTFSYFPPQILGYSRSLVKYFEENVADLDLVVFHSSIYKFIIRDVAAVCKKNNIPYILVTHGSLDPAVRGKHPFRNKILDALYYDQILLGASACHFTSDREAKRAERKLWSREIIQTFGCDQIDRPRDIVFRQRFNIPEDKFLFLYLSRITRKKGIDILLPAAISLLERGFDFYLALCGPIDSELEKAIYLAQQKTKGRIVITRLVPREMSACAFFESDCFVLPTYSENFGVAVFEAISADLKTITTTGMDLYEKLKECPIVTIISPERVSLENAMCSALRKGRIARSGLGRAWLMQNFDPLNAMNKIIEEYVAILDEKSLGR